MEHQEISVDFLFLVFASSADLVVNLFMQFYLRGYFQLAGVLKLAPHRGSEGTFVIKQRFSWDFSGL